MLELRWGSGSSSSDAQERGLVWKHRSKRQPRGQFPRMGRLLKEQDRVEEEQIPTGTPGTSRVNVRERRRQRQDRREIPEVKSIAQESKSWVRLFQQRGLMSVPSLKITKPWPEQFQQSVEGHEEVNGRREEEIMSTNNRLLRPAHIGHPALNFVCSLQKTVSSWEQPMSVAQIPVI